VKLEDFFYEGELEEVSSLYTQDEALRSPVRTTELRLRESRIRFIKQVPQDPFSTLCCPADYAAVIGIYSEALRKITSEIHERILSETNLKVKVVLGINQVDSYDVVFTKAGMLLEPLEPQYAEPRIEWSDDPYRHHAMWRLRNWRKEGWPDVYPRNAIEEEKVMGPQERQLKDEDWEE
jgi:hypothetical protein